MRVISCARDPEQSCGGSMDPGVGAGHGGGVERSAVTGSEWGRVFRFPPPPPTIRASEEVPENLCPRLQINRPKNEKSSELGMQKCEE